MTEKDAILEAVKAAYHAIDEKFGENISVLRITNISVLADYFVIATAATLTQIQAIEDEVERKLKDHGIRLRHTEDFKGSKWALMDFGVIVVHLFQGEEREFYNLDAIWRDAERIVFE